MNNGSSKGLYSHAKASALKSFGSDTLKERQNRAVLSLSLSLSPKCTSRAGMRIIQAATTQTPRQDDCFATVRVEICQPSSVVKYLTADPLFDGNRRQEFSVKNHLPDTSL